MPPAAPLSGAGITPRAFFIGVLASLLIGMGIAYADNAIRGSYLALDFGSPCAVFLLFILAFLINPLLGRIRRGWYLAHNEVVLVYIMALVAAAIPSMGLTGFLLPYLSGAHYYATPENQWSELFLEYVPDWLVVHQPEAIKSFYEGNEQDSAGVHWSAWLPPLLAWTPFLLALYLVMIAWMVILRRQWMDHERLVYPLIQPSLALMEQQPGRLMPPLSRSWPFWIGLAIPFSIGVVNGLHAYFHFIAPIELQTNMPIFRQTTTLRLALSFTTLGFAFFLSRDVALGIWLFNLIAKLQEGTFNMLGVDSGEYMEWVTVPILAHQNMGAMTVLVLFGLWTGRAHLRSVALKALGRAPKVRDDDEILSYRTAVLLVVGGSLFMWWWLVLTGLPVWAAGVVLAMGFIIFLGLTRMATEGGLFITRAPMNPGNFTVSGFGVEALGATGVTALGYTFVWAGEMRIFVMVACANALKLAEHIGKHRRLLLWAILAAIVASAAGSIWMALELCYRYGGINLSSFYTSLVNYPFRFIARNLQSGPEVNWAGWLWTAYGGTLMGLLLLAKQRLMWWPVHPLSLPISAMWMTDTIFLSVFLSWAIKGALLKYGGPKLYQNAKPLFIGLVVGQFSSMGFWVVVDFCTGMTDNLVYWL